MTQALTFFIFAFRNLGVECNKGYLENIFLANAFKGSSCSIESWLSIQNFTQPRIVSRNKCPDNPNKEYQSSDWCFFISKKL